MMDTQETTKMEDRIKTLELKMNRVESRVQSIVNIISAASEQLNVISNELDRLKESIDDEVTGLIEGGEYDDGTWEY